VERLRSPVRNRPRLLTRFPVPVEATYFLCATGPVRLSHLVSDHRGVDPCPVRLVRAISEWSARLARTPAPSPPESDLLEPMLGSVGEIPQDKVDGFWAFCCFSQALHCPLCRVNSKRWARWIPTLSTGFLGAFSQLVPDILRLLRGICTPSAPTT